jgi:hypothetical protein
VTTTAKKALIAFLGAMNPLFHVLDLDLGLENSTYRAPNPECTQYHIHPLEKATHRFHPLEKATHRFHPLEKATHHFHAAEKATRHFHAAEKATYDLHPM